jgi:membrane protein YdbS with pleckstrin-like domain
MVSRENAVIVTSLLVALAVGAGLVQYTDAPSWVAMAVFIVLGVVVPTAINESSRRDRGGE